MIVNRFISVLFITEILRCCALTTTPIVTGDQVRLDKHETQRQSPTGQAKVLTGYRGRTGAQTKGETMAKKPECDCPKHAEKVNKRTGEVTCGNCGKSKGYDLTVLAGKGK